TTGLRPGAYGRRAGGHFHQWELPQRHPVYRGSTRTRHVGYCPHRQRRRTDQRNPQHRRHPLVRAAGPDHAHTRGTYRAAACTLRRYRCAATRRHTLMPSSTLAKRLAIASLAVASLTALTGCGLLIVGGTAATTAVVATDRRTTGEQVEDQAIELKAAAEMRKLFADTARVNVLSYEGLVLLTGDVPTIQDSQKAEAAASKVEKVRKVVNQLRIGPITPVSVRTNDTWLTSKVKTALINTKEVPSRTINVSTERGVV